MNGLNINYEQTILLGKEIMSKAEEFDDVIKKIEEVLENLKLVWQGNDATKFIEELTNDTMDMKSYCNVINDIGILLQSTAQMYQNVSNNNMF